jgi:alpha-galactosidase
MINITESALILLLINSTMALENGIGLRPPMGWNTWNAYGCNINQDKIIQNAEKVS